MAKFLENTASVKREAGRTKKKKKQETTQKKVQSPSVSQRAQETNQRLTQKYGGGSTRTSSSSQRNNQTQQNLPNRRYQNTMESRNPRMLDSPTNQRRYVAPETTNGGSQGRRNQQYLEEDKKRRQRESEERRQAAQRQKMGMNSMVSAEGQEAANRAVRNTPSVVKESAKQVGIGHGKTLADVTALNESSAIGSKIDIKSKEFQEDIERRRKKSTEKSREAFTALSGMQERSEKRMQDLTKDAKGFEKAYYGALESGTGMLADRALGPAWAVSMFSRTYGNTRGKAQKEGATESEDRANALLQAAKETATEYMFRGAGLAKGLSGKWSLAPAEKLANLATRNMKGPVADAVHAGIRLLGGVGEENLEEAAAWGVEPLIEEYTYKRNVRARKAQATKDMLRDQSDSLRSNIQSPEQAEAVASYLSSPEFIESNMQTYKDTGMSDKDARELAESMRDYLTATMSGDTDTMESIEDELSKKFAGKGLSKEDWSFSELMDTFAATTLLTGATGLPGAATTAMRGSAIRDQLGDQGVRALADTAIDFEDKQDSLKAQAMSDRMNSGKEITSTQAYDLMQAAQKQYAKDSNRQDAAYKTARRTIDSERLVTPFQQERDGSISLDEVTAKNYQSSERSAREAINAALENDEQASLTDTKIDRGSQAIAGFQTGVFTVDDANELNFRNTAVRDAFKAETGIDLSQYIVKGKDGEVDIPATNTKTKEALFALAADNLVKSAQAETANWMDNTKGEVVTQITKRMGSQGSIALQTALDDVDERDRARYMTTANASDMLYHAGREMGADWEDVKSYATSMYKSIPEEKLKAMYDAGIADRDMATDKARGAQIAIGEAISEQNTSEPAPMGELIIDAGVEVKGSVIRTFSEIASNLGVDIRLVDQFVDKDGKVLKNQNGMYDPKTGTISINVRSDFEKNIGYIFMHECTHHLKMFAPEQYNELENLVRDKWFNYDSAQMQSEIAKKIELYAAHGQTLTEEQALEEIIADATHEFINDSNFAKIAAEENPSLAKAMLDTIRNAMRAIRRILSLSNLDDETHMNTLFSQLGILDEAERLWLNAYTQAVANRAAVGIEDLQNRIYEEGRTAASIGDGYTIGEDITENEAAAEAQSARFSIAEDPAIEDLDQHNATVEDEDGNGIAHFQEDGSVMFSISSYDEEGRDIYKKYLDKMVNDGELSQKEADDMLNELETIYRISKEFADKVDKNGDPIFAPFSAWSYADVVTDAKGKPVFSAIKKNSEYKMNIDFSTICKKRRTLDAVFREMINRGMFEKLDLNKDESAAMVVNINDLIRQHKFEAACALCFVEARRYRQQQTATTFRDMWNDLVESMYTDKSKIAYFNFGEDSTVEDVADGIHTMSDEDLDLSHLEEIANAKKNGKPVQTAEAKAARLILKDPSQRKLMRVGDMMASTGFENMQIQNPELMKIYNSKKGTGGAKSSFGDVQYLNEMLKSKTFDRMKAYAVSGVRIQSFSDYVPRMVFDYVQVIADLAAKKLPAHAYTKEVLFARQFGLTGAKINLSLVPDVVPDGKAPGLDSEGNYIWNEEGTFPYDEAMELQEAEGYKENCGTIAVGISDAQIMKMLADPTIQMVIPYHKSSLNPIVAAMTNVNRFKNYEDVQNTKDENGKSLSGKKDFNWDNKLFRLTHDTKGNLKPKSKWGNVQDLVKEYVEWCEKKGYTPKFADFLYARENNDINGEILTDADGNKIINPGYYKLLEDFALLDNDGNFKPQGDVQMRFPTESDAFGSMKDLIEQGLSEDTALEAKRSAEIGGIVDEIEGLFEEGRLTEQSATSQKLAQKFSISSDVDAEEIARIKAKKRTNKRDREILRDAGEKLKENDFYNLYTAHIINLGGKGENADQMVESIKKNGFKGSGGFGVNLVDSSINNIRRQTEEEIRADYAQYGIPEDRIEEKINQLKETTSGPNRWIDGAYYEGINVTVDKYGGRKGQTVMLVPEHHTTNDRSLVETGFKPFDYEIVKVERDFQPYYELYSKAYDEAQTRYSITPQQDSDGNILTDGQMEYFKNSQARDENGRLVPMYHVTPIGGFTIFDSTYSFDETSISFSNSLDFALNYSSDDGNPDDWATAQETRLGDGETEGRGHYKVYLNMENPLIVTDDMFEEMDIYEWPAYAKSEGYDGVIHKDFDGEGGDIYQVFSSSQIKDTRNENPSENPDIRYSFTDEDELAAYVNETAESMDEMYYTDPELEEGRVRLGKAKADFIFSKSTKWNQRWLTEGLVLDEKKTRKAVKEAVMNVMSKAEGQAKYKNELVNEAMKTCKRAFYLMKIGKFSEAGESIYDLSRKMVEDNNFFDDAYEDTFNSYVELRDHIKSMKLYVPDLGAEEYAEHRRNDMGKIWLCSEQKGTPIDEEWDDLCRQWPEWFDINEAKPTNMLYALEHALEAAQPMAKALCSEEAVDYIDLLANQLYDIVYEGEEYQSIADEYKASAEKKTAAMKVRFTEAMQKMDEMKAQHRAEIQKLKAKNRQNLKTQKMKYEYQIAELKQNREYNIQRLKAEKQRAVREEKQKNKRRAAERKAKAIHKKHFDSITKNYKKLVDRLLTNTKDKNIPEIFKKELANTLAAFDLQTVASKEAETHTSPADKYGNQYVRVEPTNKTIQMMLLRSQLEKISEDTEDFQIRGPIVDILKRLSDNIEGKTIDELNESEIADVDDMLKALVHEFNEYKRVTIEGKKQEYGTIASAQIEHCLAHAEALGKGNDYFGMLGAIDNIMNMDEVTPAYLFRRIDPERKGIGKMYREIRKSFDKYVRNQAQLNEWMNEILGPYQNSGKAWNKYGADQIAAWRDVRSVQPFNLTNGSISLTPAQMMSLYCLKNRPQAMKHIKGAGVVIAPVSFQAKLHSDVKKRMNKTTPVILNDSDIKLIVGQMTKEQIAVAEKLQQLMVNQMAEWGNEAAMDVMGIRLFKEKDYFPIRSDKAALKKELNDNDFVQAIRNFGFAKAVEPKANNAIVIDDIFDVVAEHCNNMNLYNAYSKSMDDFMKVYNFHQVTGEGNTYRDISFEQALSQAFSKKAPKYIMTFLRDLNGNVSGNRTGIEDMMNKALGNAKKAAVFANGRVALQQPTAIARAFAEIDPKYLKGIAKKPSKASIKATMNEMFEHCPIALWKSWGYYDINMGKSIEDIMMNEGNWLEDRMTNLYGKLDNITWTAIWQMCKAEVEDKHSDVEKGSDEYWELVNDRMTDVVDFTQVVDSPMHRSHAMRSKGIIDKLATSFMAEPTLTYNMIRDGLIRTYESAKMGDMKSAGKIIGKTVAVYVFATALTSAFAAVWDAVRGKKPNGDDDDDKDFFGLWLANFFANMSEDIKPWNKIYYVKDVKSLIDGWESNNMALQGWKSLSDGWAQLTGTRYVKSKKSWYENLFGGLGTLTGLPLGTLIKDVRAIYHLTGVHVPLFDYVGEYLDELPERYGGGESGSGSSDKSSSKTSDKETTVIPDGKVTKDNKAVVRIGKDEMPIDIKDGSMVDNFLNHFGINLTAAEIAEAKEAEAESERQKQTEKIREKYADLSGEARDKKVWSAVTTYIKDNENDGRSLNEFIHDGDYKTVERVREMYLKAGGDEEYFTERILATSKSELKKTISADNTEAQVEAQQHIKDYMLEHGVTEDEISEIAYKSYTARDLKAAIMLNDVDAAVDELTALAEAGLTYDDFERLWDNRKKFNIKSYKKNGKYADRFKSTGTYNWPINGQITSGFGHRSSPGGIGSTNHQGLDIAGSMGDPVAASDGGIVIKAGWYGGAGKTVMIKHDDGTVTQYSHLSWWGVHEGDIVGQGQTIGNVGSTGNSTGPHLHFAVMVNDSYVDPTQYLNRK